MPGSAAKNALATAASWTFLLVCVSIGILYPDDIKRTGYWLIGTTPEALAARVTAGRAEQEQAADQLSGAVTARRQSHGMVELRAEANGHFHTTAAMNGRDIEVMVDTGATIVALTFEDAERAGIYVNPADFTYRVSTANGHAKVAPVTIEQITIGDITVRDVKAAVAERGKLGTTLLGMSFLGKLKRAEIRSGTLVLEQ